ncbi:AhpA/YtjB family protein [Paraglaciecola aquimarina]|uniref:AhpA/YtjB family protein n=1 Tax=Paraglaciecola aquimarina TaxID=1235557 RepID=A0ABU3SWN0_9ALTE|nr:AhpA/YtjB family protein [Paraglaciecola aquimarina]MDU0354392.1 AhpA/YtjB family protein [Paraglaciecola aquimarina]
MDPIRNKNNEKLNQQLTFILADKHVLAASVYDEKGKILAGNKVGASVVATYKLDDDAPLVFVQSIQYQGNIIGYLRIMLKEDKVMQYHSEYQVQLYQQLIVLMVLAGVAGILVARVFYKFRYKLVNKTPEQSGEL